MARTILLLAISLFGCRESMGPKVPTPASDPTDQWEVLLGDAVDNEGYVDYGRIESKRAVLDDYVAFLAEHHGRKADRPVERPADHLNAFNALVIYQVIERGRPQSVLDVKGWLPLPGARFYHWTQFELGPDWLSLGEIEHERIRQGELDYRVHAAMNHGTLSSPPMRPTLYTQRGLTVQLRDQMARWVNSDRALYLDGDTVVFNPIFDWYARDFTFWSAGQDLCEIAAENANGKRARDLEQAHERGCPHRFFEYDWRLNDAKRKP